MTTHSFHCPTCRAPLMPKGGTSIISCPYCQTSVVVPEELRQISSTTQWTTFVFDNFTSNDNNWLVGSQTSEYFAPINQTIGDGRYRWEAQVSRPSSIMTSWLMGYHVSDFHLNITCKHIRGSKAGSSCGLICRIQDNYNYYSFRITDSQSFAVSVIKESQWQQIVNWTRTDVIKPYGVNQLEVIAHETHFTFLINGQIVSEVDDTHFSQGLVGLAIEGYTSGEAITFDFMDLTLRAPRWESYNYSHTGTEKVLNSTLILCPYCASPVQETTVLCPVCAQDTTRDAKIELTQAQYDAELQKVCRHCGAKILNMAVLCPTCQQWQS